MAGFGTLARRVILTALTVWFTFSAWTLYNEFRPPVWGTTKSIVGDNPATALIQKGDQIDLHVYLSRYPRLTFTAKPPKYDPADAERLVPSPVLPGTSDTPLFTRLLISERLSYGEDFKRNRTVKVLFPQEFRSNETTYMHVVGTTVGTPLYRRLRRFLVWSIAVPLGHVRIPDSFKSPARYLLEDPTGAKLSEFIEVSGPCLWDSMIPAEIQRASRYKETSVLSLTSLFSAPRELHIEWVEEYRDFSAARLFAMGLGSNLMKKDGAYRFLQPLSLNTYSVPTDEYVPTCARGKVAEAALKSSPRNFEKAVKLLCSQAGEKSVAESGTDEDVEFEEESLTFNFRPISFASWSLKHRLSDTLDATKEMYGMSQYDIDSFKIMLGRKSPVMIACAFVLSLLHLLLSVSYLFADFTYWNSSGVIGTGGGKAKAEGISVASLQIELVSTAVILVYVIDAEQGRLVVALVAARLCMDVWKLSKLLGLRRRRRNKVGLSTANAKVREVGERDETVVLGNNDEDVREAEILQLEHKVMIWLNVALAPLVIAAAVYQLKCVPQKGWKSWIIKSAAVCVYTGGFVAMTPQLVRNYALRSVDHLPWNVLMYQAINTFIDDVFAFIFRLPEMQRNTVFRDDIIFLVYLGQMWWYRKPKTNVGDDLTSDSKESADDKKNN